MSLIQLKANYIQAIYHAKALIIREEPITLQSGKMSHVYLNHRNFLTHHLHLNLIAAIYHELLKPLTGNYVLGSVDSLMSPLIVGAMSAQLGKDYVVIPPSQLVHGAKAPFFGEIKHEVVLVDDMTSTGDTLMRAAGTIRKFGGKVSYAIISAYREEKALDNLRQASIEPLFIASFKEIIETLYPVLSFKEQYLVSECELIF